MGANADQFLRELRKEVRDMEREFVEFRADVVGDALAVAESRTPERSGTTKKSWGANVGARPDFESWDGSGSARAALKAGNVRAKSKVTLGNAHFVSGFLERGTVKMSARPMLRVGVESVADREQK